MTNIIVWTIIDNKVILTLPPNFKDKKEVTVLIDDLIDIKLTKIEALKIASRDSLFLEDIREIQENFA